MRSIERAPSGFGLTPDALRRDAGLRHRLWNDRRRLDRLALAARDGDPEARDVLWLAVGPPLERLARWSGVAADDAPDLVQDALIAADRHLDRFDARRGPFRAWLVTILLRLRSNLRRSAARRRTVPVDPGRWPVPRDGADGRGDIDRADARLDLARILATLAPEERAALVLSEIGGLDPSEIGRSLGLSARRARSMVRRARLHLSRQARTVVRKP